MSNRIVARCESVDKIIIFCNGQYFKYRADVLLNNQEGYEVIGIVDNDSKQWGRESFGFIVSKPDKNLLMSCNCVVIMSTYYNEIRQQLLNLGVQKDKVLHYVGFIKRYLQGRAKYYGMGLWDRRKKSILLVSGALNYNGGTMAAVYTAQVLIKHGYSVVMASERCNIRLVKELNDKGICVVAMPGLLAAGTFELKFAEQFDLIIANTLIAMSAANRFIEVRPVLWWLHEASVTYNNELEMLTKESINSKIHVLAVSEIAKRNFEKYYPNRVDGIMNYAIPDIKYTHVDDRKIIVAIVGDIGKLKGTDIFLQAIDRLHIYESMVEFWCIGRSDEVFLYKYRDILERHANIIFKGMLAREEIQRAWQQIDVAVVASREETMSMVVTEGLINSTVCIMSDAVGSADYIKDGVNGFIFKSEDVGMLADKMQYVIDSYDSLDGLRDRARSTYDKYFSMETFEKNAVREMQIANKKFYRSGVNGAA